MPTITLVTAPSPHAAAIDSESGEEYSVGIPKHTDDPSALGRLRSLEKLGFYFTSSDDESAPADPTPTEQAVTEPAPEAPAQ
jgi:hypothetical protein